MSRLQPSAWDVQVKRFPYETRPEHHIIPAEPGKDWTSYIASWNPTPAKTRMKRWTSASSGGSDKSSKSKRSSKRQGSTRSVDEPYDDIAGFRNPWPSWHKPTRAEIWASLEWGEDADPCIQLAAEQLDESKRRLAPEKQVKELLKLTPPDFEYDPDSAEAKTTWLGHAGVLVQLPALGRKGRPLRCLFDPMFSSRCSPIQSAGPARTYPPPCSLDDLPEIDVYMLSHNHFDHLDYDTVMQLWNRNKTHIKFLVPLGNRDWFVDCGIDPGSVFELDWWDTVCVSPQDANGDTDGGSQALKITCTPSQHNSGRSGTDADATLWSSWYLDHPLPTGKSYRVFFAGDSGYQFHDSPGWPPARPDKESERRKVAARVDDDSDEAKHAACPAFKMIAQRLGSPHLLLLPIALGATYDFFRSFVPVSDSLNPIPRHSLALTAHNHMPPWDAVRVLNLMTSDTNPKEKPPVAMAMHWGTFVSNKVEVLKTLGQLQWACEAHNVRFGRSLSEDRTARGRPQFVVLNHGESIHTMS